ncbi:MAG: hypothetical protein R3B40_12140 [Polyangiales bacterium]|nr:hypothetical protein [Myxococcales bacterium]MCB9657330.1 hypothetical protein [Sandaracinaceae bacterium]
MGGDTVRTNLDLALWPIVILTVREGAREADFNHLFQRYEREVFTRHERYVSITNLSMMDGVPNAHDRKQLAEWMGRHADYVGKWALGNSTVIRSAVVRGALTALYWVQKAPTAQTSHGTLREAVEWGLGTLDAAGMPRPGNVDAWYAAETRAGRGAA